MNDGMAPRCPGCGGSLVEHARYRSVSVSPGDGRPGPTLPFPLVYCGRCGTAIATLGPAPPGSPLLGLSDPTPEAALRPARLGEGPRRPPPLRHFPGPLETVGLSELPAGALVQLRYEDRRLLEGTIGPATVSLQVNVLQSRVSAQGNVGEERLAVAWNIARTSPESRDITVTVEGVFAEAPVDLRASFHFEPAAWLHHGDVAGNLAGSGFRAHVEPADGGFDSPATVAIDGVLGGGTFSVFASVTTDRARGAVRGSVDGRPLLLDVRRMTEPTGARPAGSTVRVTGAFEGSRTVMLLAIGALLHGQ